MNSAPVKTVATTTKPVAVLRSNANRRSSTPARTVAIHTTTPERHASGHTNRREHQSLGQELPQDLGW